MLDTSILPIINTGIAHKEAGVGQIGAGITRAPLDCFTQGIQALAASVLPGGRAMSERGKTAIVAVGGNSLIVDAEHESIPDQYKAAAQSSHYVADMVEAGVTVILTHGNGPQVGFILRRSGIAKGVVPEVPVDYADADTQGAIGYMFQRALYNEFKRRGLARKVVAVVTQVLVDRDDPGPRQSDQADRRAHGTRTSRAASPQNFGWAVKEDAGRGWRRVVGSPKPQAHRRAGHHRSRWSSRATS